jgi:hypothetical protein
VRALTGSTTPIANTAAALAALVLTAAALTPGSPPTAPPGVRLIASPAPGALLGTFLGNQLQNCAAICPFAVQGLQTVPIGIGQSPLAFIGTLASTGDILRAIGAATVSVTGPADTATGGIIGNDLNQVVPRFENGVEIAVVDSIGIGAALGQPGQLPDAVDTFREQVLAALDQPLPSAAPTPPPLTTPPPFGITPNPQGLLEVASVGAVDVGFAVAFQASELALLGVFQAADAGASTLATSGNPVAAVTATADTAGGVATAAGGIVANSVSTAGSQIRASLPHPAAVGITPPAAHFTSSSVGTAHSTSVHPTDRTSSGTSVVAHLQVGTPHSQAGISHSPTHTS